MSTRGNDEYRPVFRAFNLMTEKLSLSLTEQEEEERKRKELIASISHDIRTPLTVIKAYAEGLRDGVADTEEMLSVICRRADDLRYFMINQLFDLSRLDIGVKAYTEETLDLSAVLHDFIEENPEFFQREGTHPVGRNSETCTHQGKPPPFKPHPHESGIQQCQVQDPPGKAIFSSIWKKEIMKLS